MDYFLAVLAVVVTAVGFFFRRRPSAVVRIVGDVIIVTGLLTLVESLLTILGVVSPSPTNINDHVTSHGIMFAILMVLLDAGFFTFVFFRARGRKSHELSE